MSLVKKFKDFEPQLGANTWVAENATLIGEVITGEDCGIWYGAVLRGDVGKIHLGNRVNIQDNAIIHATEGKSVTIVGHDVTVGHRAILHGCTIGDNCLIGMGSIILDNAVVQNEAIVAAGAVVLENTVVESGTIFAGVPAKKVKELSAEEIRKMNQSSAAHYVSIKEKHR